MALRYVESFDGVIINTTSLALKMTAAFLPGTTWSGSPTSNTGRFGGLCAGNSPQFTIVTETGKATWIISFAFFAVQYANGDILQMNDTGTLQCKARITNTGAMEFYRGSTLVASVNSAWTFNQWYYWEFKFTIDNVSGYMEWRQDNVTKLTFSGDTQVSANAWADRLIKTNTGTGDRMDDLVIMDSTGSLNNNFLGDTRVGIIRPNGEGATIQWTRSTGAFNYATVDDITPNDDTDYNSTTTVGNIDLYEYEDATLPGPLFALQIVSYIRKDEAGTREFAQMTRTYATNYQGPTKTLASTFNHFLDIRETNPNTGLAWTDAEVDVAQFGEKLVT